MLDAQHITYCIKPADTAASQDTQQKYLQDLSVKAWEQDRIRMKFQARWSTELKKIIMLYLGFRQFLVTVDYKGNFLKHHLNLEVL